MSEGQPFQPYEPPQPLDISTDPMVAPAVKTRPGGLTAIAVIALILGGLGIAAALFGIAGLFLGKQMQQMVPAAPAGANNPMADMQEQMQDDINAVTDRFFAVNLGVLALHVCVAALLLVGGIQCLSLTSPGDRLLRTGCGLAAFFEIGRGALTTYQQMQVFGALEPYWEKMIQAQPPNPQAAEIASTAIKVGMYVGIGVALVWVLVKVIFYLIAVGYLNKPQVKALFSPQPIS